MAEKYGARVVIVLKDEFAKAVNQKGIHLCKEDELAPLRIHLERYNASLTNVMRDFEYYVQSSDAHGAEESPIIEWSRDATKNDRAKAYYGSKFVVTLGAGTKVMPMEQAEEIKRDLSRFIGSFGIKDVRIDTMDPKKNPPIPVKYFKRP